MGYLSLPFLFAEPAAAPGSSEHMVALFLFELVLLLVVGRLIGEVMQRIGQPAVMGQLIAGVILGPSLFGNLFPSAYAVVFPDVAAQKKMLDAISQFGILMLLLLTGMETDLKLVNRMRGTAVLTSISGIILPFASGYILGEFLPDQMVPDPSKRLVTSLFLATALSISSVKIVAMVIMEVGFLRRNIGQIILASAILDDTIGWIIIAIIGGIASGGAVSLSGAGLAFAGTVVFLGVSLTIGRRFVAAYMRWANDYLIMEMPVITAILVLTLAMSLLTDYIGVHTVLGSFVVGILVGQSPILTKHVEEQLRGLIVAFFAPVFFVLAGREVDLSSLNTLSALEIALGFIVIASIGKMAGAYIGGRLGQLGNKMSTALAIGMNARGSTEVIVATIGLSLGVLNRNLFTMIVVMAITTTLVTPPLLRWALKRIPPTGEEKKRLEREEAQEKQFVPGIERVLVAADASANGSLAGVLAGLFGGTQELVMTVLDLGVGKKSKAKKTKTTGEPAQTAGELLEEAVAIGFIAADRGRENKGEIEEPVVLIDEKGEGDIAEVVLAEIEKGFDMIFLGLNDALEGSGKDKKSSSDAISEIVADYEGVSAIAIARGRSADIQPAANLNILLPITGTDYSQLAAEVAVRLAKASSGRVEALHILPRADEVAALRGRSHELTRVGADVLKEVKKLGKFEKVKVDGAVKKSHAIERVILAEIKRSKCNLVVLGVKTRADNGAFFGPSTAALIEKSPCSLLIISS